MSEGARNAGVGGRSASVADELRAQMNRRGLSIRQLGRRSGVDHTAISRILRDERPASPGTLLRLRLALALGWSSTSDDDRHIRAVAQLLLDDPALDEPGVEGVLAAYRLARAATRDRGEESW